MQTFDASNVVFSRASTSPSGMGSGVFGLCWGPLGNIPAWDRTGPLSRGAAAGLAMIPLLTPLTGSERSEP